MRQLIAYVWDQSDSPVEIQERIEMALGDGAGCAYAVGAIDRVGVIL